MSDQPNLGILNLSSHENMLSDVCEIMVNSCNLTVFTTNKTHKRISDQSDTGKGTVEWDIKRQDETDWEFLSRVQRKTETNLDVLISFPFYGRIFDYLRYDRFSPACPFMLFAFDLNGWIGRNPGFTLRVDNYLKYPLKRRFLGKVDTLLVEFEPIREYIERHSGSISIRTFTPVLYRGEEDQVNNNSVTHKGGENTHNDGESTVVVTIPGMIDKSRRDYDTIISALGHLSETQLADLEFILLGRPVGEYGKKIIEQANALHKMGANVVNFEEWIPRLTFEQYLIRSDLLVSPLRQTRQVDGFIEEYGRSKGSGAISDAIRHATPLLLPEWYKVPTHLTPGIRSFNGSKDLYQIINNLLTDDMEYKELDQGARQIVKSYNKKKQQKRLRTIIDEQSEGHIGCAQNSDSWKID